MPNGFLGSVKLSIVGSYNGSNDLGTPKMDISEVDVVDLIQGTASGAADLMFSDERTLAASANESLDLAGSLVDPLGATLTFAKIKAIIVIAAAANTNDVVVGAAASPFVGPLGGTTPTISVKPGGFFAIAHPGAGWTVTASSADLLKIANSSSGTGVTYKIILIGTSA